MTEAAEQRITEEYRARREQHRGAANHLARVNGRIGLARLACVAAIVLGAAAIIAHSSATVGTIVIVLAVAALVALVAWHGAVRDRLRLSRALVRGCDTGIDRVLRHWDALPPAPLLPHSPDHPFADDLNVTGEYSVARLLPVLTAGGREAIGAWLLADVPPPADVIRGRQHAIGDLAPACEWRERFAASASAVRADAPALEHFLNWAEGDTWLAGRPAVRWSARVLMVAGLAAVIGAIAGVVPVGAAVLLLAANVVYATALRRRLRDVLERSTGHSARLAGYARLLRDANLPPVLQSTEVQAVAARAGGDESAAAFASLDRLARSGEMRYSPMAHAALQVLALWDVHVVDALERWQQRYGRLARRWFDALAELEALAAFATLAYENPDWSYPIIVDDRTLDAADLAHPLLATDGRVGNDVAIGPPRPLLVITGSNMAGKTTLLRAIGLNVVLANAGAPVCASAMRLPRLRVRTSISAVDALDRGLSLYMAELLRVRAIVDAAHAAADCPLLYLGDELLRGTNADDRRAALVTILRHLVHTTAIGAVATHDPEIARDADLTPCIRPVHLTERFRESAGESTMWFDYQLRPGLASSGNAIKLLELVGLSESRLAALGRGAI